MKNILLVDDEAIVRIGVKNCVNWNSLGITNVLEASNGKDALDIIRTQKIDIVITDLKMSVMDGFSMLDELNNLHDFPKPYIIIMSCYNDYDTMRKAILYGVKDFLFKPKMFPEDIENAISALPETPRSHESVSAFLGNNESQISCYNYIEYFNQLVNSFKNESKNVSAIIKEITSFTVALMELDSPETPSLHTFSLILFQKLVELKKQKTTTDCIELLSNIQSNPNYSIKEKLSQALLFIESHISDPDLNQEMVAEYIGLSPSYFCRLFKNETGSGYSTYIIKKRIELANILLNTTDLKISEISKSVGYTNEHYFTRLYKEFTGHSMRNAKKFSEAKSDMSL